MDPSYNDLFGNFSHLVDQLGTLEAFKKACKGGWKAGFGRKGICPKNRISSHWWFGDPIQNRAKKNRVMSHSLSFSEGPS